MATHKVLSTKKLSSSLIDEAKQKGVDIVEQEFITINPIETAETYNGVIHWLIQEEPQHIVFTSANAVESIKNYLHQGSTWYVPNWNIFSLSGKTKEAIQTPYFNQEHILATADHAAALAEKVIEAGVKEVVFFCGNRRRDELPTILKQAGITVHEVVVYETVETPLVATDAFDAVLFFSPSAVQSFFSVNELKKDTVCFAIGKSTAERITDFTDEKIIVSPSPTQEMMLNTLHFYFENSNCYE